VIELTAVQRDFRVGEETVHALQDVHLSINQGDYVAIMGPSGSGKSTLLNIIGLLDRPSSGAYRLENVDTTDLTDTQQAGLRRHKIGFVFQFFHLVPRLTAFENIELPMMLAGVETSTRKEKVQAALSAFRLEDRARHRPDQLSGGQRQRVAIARATIMQPRIILADEPTGNLDHASGREVIDILEQLNREDITLIMVTHDLQLGKRAKYRISMSDGAIAREA
jgi:putative ABC transport system ATP-binding protein